MILMHYKELLMICFQAMHLHIFISVLISAHKIQWIIITLNVNQMLISIIFHKICNIYKNLFLKLLMIFNQYTRRIIYHIIFKVLLD